jgi:hypothetical protein
MMAVQKIRRAAVLIQNPNHLVIRMIAASHPQKTHRNQKIIKTMTAMKVRKERRRAVQQGITITKAEIASLGETHFFNDNEFF